MRTELYRPNTKEGNVIAGNIQLAEVRKFNFSDVFRTPDKIDRYQDEVKRYEVIANHFWENAVLRLRENEMNIKYLKEASSRLSEIKEMPELPLETRLLCSRLIKTIKASFGP